MASPDPEQVRRQVGRIIASPVFNRTARLSQFLTYLVEESLGGRTGEIKESSVAVRVFGRKPSYDPRIDSIVRVEAHNLRNRLREYYLRDGAADEVIIDLPVGSYVPAFRQRDTAPAVVRSGASWWTSWRTVLALLMVVLAVAAAAVGVALYSSGEPPNTVAVLPLANLGGPDMESLCQGFTEDLTTELARLPELRVTARTSASRFPAKTADLREVGRQLGVRALLEGSIRKDGGRIRVTAQLIDARSGYHTWSEAFDRDAGDAFGAEAEIVRLIVAGVGRRLGVKDLSPASPTHLPPAPVQDLFWRARYLWSQRAPAAREQAVELLERAVASDPLYSQAWAVLASIESTRTFHGEVPFDEAAAKARTAASRTLDLNPRNPEAHLALAKLEWIQDRNWNATEARFRRLLALNPSFASGRGWFATALLSRGRFEEALAELGRAVSLNPIAYVVSNDEATMLYCARRYDQAVARARKTLEADPKFFFARVVIGACHAARGRYTEAIAEFRQVLAQTRGAALGRLGHALARSGQRAEAESLLRELKADAAGPGQSWVHAAFVEVGLGDMAGALHSLEQAYPHHETDLMYVGVEPIFDPLRGQPRFQALKQKLGL